MLQLFLSKRHCHHRPNSPQRWWNCGVQLSAWRSLEATGSVTFLLRCVVYPKKENGDPRNRWLFLYKHIYCQRLRLRSEDEISRLLSLNASSSPAPV